MIELIELLERIKTKHPEMTYREIIKGAGIKIPDFTSEIPQTLIAVLTQYYGN